MSNQKSGSNLLFNEAGDVVGFKDVDGSEVYFAHSISHVDVQLRAASTAVPTVPTVLVLPDLASKSGEFLDYDPITGVFTFKRDGLFFHDFLINTKATAGRTIYAGAQILVDEVWTASQYSGRKISVTANVDGQGVFQSNNIFRPELIVPQPFTAGTKLRFVWWASGACTVVTEDLPDQTLGLFTTPAIRIMYSCLCGAFK